MDSSHAAARKLSQHAGWLLAVSAAITASSILVGLGATATGHSPNTRHTDVTRAAAPGTAKHTSARTPLAFEPNVGQTDPRVAYVAHGVGYTLFLTRRGETVLSRPDVDGGTDGSTVRMQFLRSKAPRLSTRDRLGGRVNYLVGDNPQKWHRNVPLFRRVTGRELYPGIGVVWYGHGAQLEYDLRVAPGADPRRVAVRFPGATRVRDTQRGDVMVSIDGHTIRQQRPVAFQVEPSGARRHVRAAYVVRRGVVRLQVGQYDHERTLIIDPVLGYSTFLGGVNYDEGHGIAVDANGYAYVAGYTTSTDFPTAAAMQPANHGGADAFVTKLTPDGNAVVFSTYLGGSRDEWPSISGNFVDQASDDIAIDANGHVFVAGTTSSSDFPTADPVQSSNAGGSDAFLAELSPDGGSLLFSTYLGGGGNDNGFGVAVDSNGAAYVAGATASTNFPTAGAGVPVNSGGSDAFAAKLASDQLVYSTYLGGSDQDFGYGIAVDGNGSAYVTGGTASTNFPVASLVQPVKAGSDDAFVTKLSPVGGVAYSTYLGGSSTDEGFDIAVDAAGSAYVTGITYFSGFPTANAFQPSNGGGQGDGFVTKLNPQGSGLVYSSFLGGGSQDFAYGIAVDANGSAYVTGYTMSSNFPTASPLQASYTSPQTDAFVTKVSPSGRSLSYSTFLGGSGGDVGHAIAVRWNGSAYVTGWTSSPDFPTLSPYQGSIRYHREAFITRIDDSGAAVPTITGTAREGSTLSVSLNGWPDGATAASYSYQWRRCDQSAANCVDISGATNNTYFLRGMDVGRTIRVHVTASISATDTRAIDSASTAIVVGTDLSGLAATFRPWLRFDEHESWRPLNVDHFLAEVDPSRPSQPYNAVCDATSCNTNLQTGTGDLALRPNGFIQVGSLGPGGTGGDPSDYRSPESECSVNGLWDCDLGPQAGLYYHAVRSSSSAYIWLDYWEYFRFNDLKGLDHHEGDWEGLVVAVNGPSATAFDAVGFAQHTGVSWKLPGSLTCDGGTPCGHVDPLGTGAVVSNTGQRVHAFVADGSHAAYGESCDGGCRQEGTIGFVEPEGDHDGTRPWGANSDPGALIAFPEGTGSWASWAGRWGSSCSPSFNCGEWKGIVCSASGPCNSPQSPGKQERFTCPSNGNPLVVEPCTVPARRRSAGARIALSASDCNRWVGSFAAVACSPSELRRAIATGSLSRNPRFWFVPRRRYRVGAGAGVGQVAGAPLRAGQQLVLRGTTHRDTFVAVRVATGHGVATAVFRGVALRGGRAVIRAVRSKNGVTAVMRLGPQLVQRPAKVVLDR